MPIHSRRPPTILALIILCLCTATAHAQTTNPIIEKILKEQSPRIPREALVKALDYYHSNPDQIANKNFITIVNYNLPSTEKRMHVIDMTTGEVEDFYVAHGKNSGVNYASRFSNKSGSLQSSLGIYLTAEQYQGKHGTSMRLDGQEESNNNARKRAIVFHGANYVSQDIVNKQGRLGRSFGCLAVEQPLVQSLVQKLKGSSVILVHRDASAPADESKSSQPDAIDEK